jgi:peptidoglycan/xylan/chitin deacetylase (PgdA/CDA1 family)
MSACRVQLAMIGVIAAASEAAVVVEFFELFKTPWEWYRSGKQYQVLLCVGEGEPFENGAELVLFYAGHRLALDADKVAVATHSCEEHGRMLRYKKGCLPIYGGCVTFGHDTGPLIDEENGQPAICSQQLRTGTIIRIGYDLFGEVRTLLTVGQPAANAAIPTLDLHVTVLRDLIVSHGVLLVEIPPVPDGHPFITCLTHDVDHPLVRRHWMDPTMFGFLYRAILGSLVRVLQRRLSARGLLINWVAALKLPLIYLGLADDFWLDFGRYIQLEGESRSTFFLIPFRNRPGTKGRGSAPDARAAAYGADDLSDLIRKLMEVGCEIGLHGIDAWHDVSSGSAELEEIRRIVGRQEIGVRMHWLYYDEQSPVTLEQAGMIYDSTVGYNETIGYRAGTTQVYKPLQTTRLLELPLHVMDTALFYPNYLNLSDEDAWEQVGSIIRNAIHLGGCITVNWHDRSITPERQWGHFYEKLIEELRTQGAWFSTAAQAALWFRMRRSAVFENVTSESDRVQATIAISTCANVPGLQLRVHQAAGYHLDIPIHHKASDRCRADGLHNYTISVSVPPAPGCLWPSSHQPL